MGANFLKMFSGKEELIVCAQYVHWSAVRKMQ